MAKPDSYDLRQKVIQAIELDGWKKSQVSKLFNISRNTIDLWLKSKVVMGDFQAKKTKTPRGDRKIIDWDKFREFAKTHGDKTQKEMAQLCHDDISQRTISRALNKIGFTRKKRLTVTANALEVKRQQFLEQLATWSPEKIVYVDESGMDNREDYGYGWNSQGERFHADKSGKRKGRVNMIAALCQQSLFAPFTLVGACNRTDE